MTPSGTPTRLGILTFADADSPDLGAAGLGAILAGLDPMVSWRRRSNTLIDVVGTAALTPIFSQVIPAGLLGANGRVRGSVRGDWLDNAGSNQGCRLQIVFGGVTVWDASNFSLGVNSASRAPWRFDFDLFNLGATGSQFIETTAHVQDTSLGAATVGIGVIGGNAAPGEGASAGTLAIDTTLAQTLTVNLAPSVSNALLSFRRYFAEVEVS